MIAAPLVPPDAENDTVIVAILAVGATNPND